MKESDINTTPVVEGLEQSAENVSSEQTEIPKVLTSAEKLMNMDQGIAEKDSAIAALSSSNEKTDDDLKEVRKSLGISSEVEKPSGIAANEEKINKLQAEKEALEKERQELLKQQERQKMVEEEKKKILQEKIDQLFQQFQSAPSQEGVVFKGNSSGMGAETMQALAQAFKGGIKSLPDLMKAMPDLLSEVDEQVTKEAEERVDRQIEEKIKEINEKDQEIQTENQVVQNKQEEAVQNNKSPEILEANNASVPEEMTISPAENSPIPDSILKNASVRPEIEA